MCGEKGCLCACQRLGAGSPPRVWGKDIGKPFHIGIRRITPTCVGKRSQYANTTKRYKDHPHVCGEKLKQKSFCVPLKGSPPRVWGKGIVSTSSFLFIRITPTCVGKRYQQYQNQFQQKDHPHVCGEKLKQKSFCVPLKGSPPRVWGKGKLAAYFCITVRITPTCVGKSA